jgi:selenide,water dikinase
MECIPGGTRNNFKSYGHKIEPMTAEQEIILCDAQTSGGLLVIVQRDSVDAFLKITKEAGLDLHSIGHTCELKEKSVKVI